MKKIDIKNIIVEGEIGRRIDMTINNNLLKIDIEKDFLLLFSTSWCGEEIRSFVGLGKLMDALTRFAFYNKQADMVALRLKVLNIIEKLQEEDGYLGIMPPEKRFNTLWDVHERAFLIIGLINDYSYWKEDRVLVMAQKLADGLIAEWKSQNTNLPDLYFSTLGAEEGYLDLYGQTKDKKYLEFVSNFLKLTEWNEGIAVGRMGKAENRVGRRTGIGMSHVYYFLSVTIAQQKLGNILEDNKLFSTAKRVIDFMLNKDGMMITGEVGNGEAWRDNQEGFGDLGETCATAYTIMFMDTLLQNTYDSLYGDVMERIIYNGLFAAQAPDGRKLRYFTPIEGDRGYFNYDFYCCPGNFRRIMSKLPEMVFYQSKNKVIVNLYTPSTAKIQLEVDANLVIRQETDYPNSGKVYLELEPDKEIEFILSLRIPKWCKGARIEVNNEVVAGNLAGGSFFELERVWTKGDKVVIDFPMEFRFVKGRKMQVVRVAIMRGPVVFCLNKSKYRELDGMDVRLVTIAPETITGPFIDNTVRENGLACKIMACIPKQTKEHEKPNVSEHIKPDFELTLTEFTDPKGEEVYFRLPGLDVEGFVEDELLARSC